MLSSSVLENLIRGARLLVYPPTGTGAVNITRGDLKRLDEGQYLNDTLIEFGLKCVSTVYPQVGLALIDP